ncbi:hypothetical protein Tco_1268236, partial [Tanacetum coccineum]
ARGVEVRLTVEIVGNVPMCGYALREGFCWVCPSRDENSSIDAPNPNSFNDPPNVFTHPPQPQYETYSCELCGNDSHYGYDCPPRFPLSIQEDLNQQKMNDEFKIELRNELLNTMQSLCERILQREQAANERTIPLNEITSQISLITTVLPTMEPEDSLIIGNEHLSTILEKESDEFIKSSVEDLVLIPSESEDTSGSDNMEISTDIENSYHDSKGDIICLESLLINDTIPNLPSKVFLDHDTKNLKDEPDNKDFENIWYEHVAINLVSQLESGFPAEVSSLSNTNVSDSSNSACSHYRNVSKQTER